jgi:sugar (pentulose or hexulose) kinase
MNVSSLAVDIGGTFVKAAAIENRSLGPVSRLKTPGFLEERGVLGDLGVAREISPELLSSTVQSSIDLTSHSKVDAERVLVSGQMAGLAFVNESGSAVAPIISWQDTRYTDLRAVTSELTPNDLFRLGDGLRIGSPLVTLRQHDRPTDCYTTSLIAFAAGQVEGQRAKYLHPTDAAAWGLFDLLEGTWSQRACEVAGIEVNSLPQVSMGVQPITPGSNVQVAVGDQQAALLGADLSPGWISVNLATGCQVSVLAKSLSRFAQTRPYFGDVFGGKFIHTVTHLPAGRLLSSSLRASRGFEDWDWLAGEGFDHLEAITVVVNRIVDAARQLDSVGLPILFSGGIVQQLPRLREAIAFALDTSEYRVYEGDDAALAGLSILEKACFSNS